MAKIKIKNTIQMRIDSVSARAFFFIIRCVRVFSFLSLSRTLLCSFRRSYNNNNNRLDREKEEWNTNKNKNYNNNLVCVHLIGSNNVLFERRCAAGVLVLVLSSHPFSSAHTIVRGLWNGCWLLLMLIILLLWLL